VIARLTGQLVERTADSVVVDVHGVGYKVAVSKLTVDALPREGEAVSLRIHTHVREDAILLFGFLDNGEIEAFEALITMSGMGPKAAIGVLSGIDVHELARAVAREDLARLCLVPGIGKKKAERMVLELKERLLHLARPDEESPADDLEDLRSALANLGFKPAEVEQAVVLLRKQVVDGQDLDTLLPQALRILRG